MWQPSLSPMRLCLLVLSIFAACSVDLSKLRAHGDASPDLVLPSGGAGGSTVDARGRLDERGSADLPTIGRQDAQANEGIDGSSSPGVDEASTDGGVDGAGDSGGGGAIGGVDGAGGTPGVDVGLDQTDSMDGNSDAVIALDARDAPAASGGETGTDGGTWSTMVKLTGTPFGTGPAWFNGSSTFDKVFDGDITTYDDDSNTSGGYTGIDLGAGVSATVAVIRYYPRPAWNDRLMGGKFQCSTTSQTDGYSDLYTIAAEPPLAWTQVTIASTTPCRYLRYLGPTNGLTNIAEVEFWGVSSAGGDAGAPVGGTSLVNLAYNKTTMASSQAPSSNYAAYGNDGLLTSEFCPASATYPDWWLVDLGTVYALVETDINFENSISCYRYKIEVSTDGASWTTTVDQSNNTTRFGGTVTDASNVRARYVRLTISGSSATGDWGCFREVLVWGYNTPS
jgi:F5/8 type C domain